MTTDAEIDGGDDFEMIDLTTGAKRFALLVQPHGATMQSFFDVHADDIEDVLDAVASAMATEEPVLTKRDEKTGAILLVGIPRAAAVQILPGDVWDKLQQDMQKAQADALAAQRFGVSAPTKIVRKP